MNRRELHIASYNIRKTRGLDQRRDPGRTLDVINALGADIVVLQEADRRLGQRKAALPRAMIAAHSDFDVVPLASREESLGWHGNAVLVRQEFDVAQVMRIDLPGLEPRGAAIVALTGAVHITLVATHLGLRRRDRQDQQRAICTALQSASSTIIAGDFNEWSTKDGFEPFEESFTVHAPGRSFPTRLPVAKLDRFATSSRVDVVASDVFDGHLARRASDHLPVRCTISAPHSTAEPPKAFAEP